MHQLMSIWMIIISSLFFLTYDCQIQTKNIWRASNVISWKNFCIKAHLQLYCFHLEWTERIERYVYESPTVFKLTLNNRIKDEVERRDLLTRIRLYYGKTNFIVGIKVHMSLTNSSLLNALKIIFNTESTERERERERESMADIFSKMSGHQSINREV